MTFEPTHSQRPGPILHLDFANCIEQGLRKRQVRHHVAEEILEPAHPERDFENAGRVPAQHVGDPAPVHQFISLLTHPLIPAWVQRIGESVSRQTRHRVDTVQRVPAHVVVKPAVLRLPPLDSPLVLDLVITVFLPGRSCRLSRFAGVHTVNVHRESPLQIVVHPVQLLDRILDLARRRWQPEILPQPRVSQLVDPGENGATQVVRHPVRFAMPQGGLDPRTARPIVGGEGSSHDGIRRIRPRTVLA